MFRINRFDAVIDSEKVKAFKALYGNDLDIVDMGIPFRKGNAKVHQQTIFKVPYKKTEEALSEQHLKPTF